MRKKEEETEMEMQMVKKDKEKGENTEKQDQNMVGGQEQDELGNMMTLKYFWFPILITGAGISLIKRVCRR